MLVLLNEGNTGRLVDEWGARRSLRVVAELHQERAVLRCAQATLSVHAPAFYLLSAVLTYYFYDPMDRSWDQYAVIPCTVSTSAFALFLSSSLSVLPVVHPPISHHISFVISQTSTVARELRAHALLPALIEFSTCTQ